MKRTRVQHSLRCAVSVGVLALAGLGLLTSEGLAQTDDPVTYAKDVAPIIQANCQLCHRPGSVAPMSLQEYEEVRAFAPLIRERVVNRIMPPWHISTERLESRSSRTTYRSPTRKLKRSFGGWMGAHRWATLRSCLRR